ncbi:MAG: hypothetical protein LBS89_06590 [Zoogloeaceae bacterium]|jgi:gp16 family phage-associated protein|nr:hypothetical protein [Zoogloeaceae bacterium]
MKKERQYPALSYPQTPETARQWFVDNGICQSHWAKSFGIGRFQVIDLLRGRSFGKRGMSHRAAILLGMKPEPRKR